MTKGDVNKVAEETETGKVQDHHLTYKEKNARKRKSRPAKAVEVIPILQKVGKELIMYPDKKAKPLNSRSGVLTLQELL